MLFRSLIEMGSKKQARSFFNVGMAKKFMQTVLVADALSELQRADLTTSLREIYYRTKHTIQDSHENTFDTQDESDPVIEDLEVSLAATQILQNKLALVKDRWSPFLKTLFLKSLFLKSSHPGGREWK